MVVNVVVRLADLDSIVRCYAAQLTLCWPAHLWFAVRRSTPVSSEEKRRVHAHLVDLEARLGPSPFVHPPGAILHEAWTIDHVVAAMLAPGERRVFAEAGGEFHGVAVESGSSDRTVPFTGTYFLVTSDACHEGSGSFKDVVSKGTVLVRHARLLKADRASGPEGVPAGLGPEDASRARGPSRGSAPW